MTQDVVRLLKEGQITPEEAYEKSTFPGSKLSDIEVNFGVKVLKSGFPSLEHYRYLRAGQPDLVILGARPGVGKSALALQLAINVGKHTQVMLFTLEMSNEQLMKRALMIESGKPEEKLELPVNQPAIRAAREALAASQLYCEDTNGIDINTLINRCVEFHRRSPVGLVVVDYLQIVKTPKGRTKAEEVGDVCEGLKKLALTINCPVFALAQLNREFEKRLSENPTAEPTASDFADSSSIEKWADMAMIMHRPYPTTAKLWGIKNRHGQPGEFTLQFSGALSKFIDNGDIGCDF